MNRSGGIAIGAAIGGLAIAIVMAFLVPSEDRTPPKAMAPPAAVGQRTTETQHCRMVTDADAQCSALWEDRRRHFFGTDRQP